jgi:hypothetical protein
MNLPIESRGPAPRKRTTVLAGLIFLLACSEPAGPERQEQLDPSGPATATISDPTGELAASADSFVGSIGVNVHLRYSNVYRTGYSTIIKPKLQALGIRHLRDGGQAYPDPNWMRMIYGKYADVTATTGARFTLITSPYGNRSGWNFSDGRVLDSMYKYAGPGVIEAWENLNEWNASGRSNWANELRTWQRTIWAKRQQNYPSLAVVGPSLTSYSAATTVGDLSGYLTHGNLHSYPGGKQPTNWLQRNMTEFRRISGSKPFAVTETGYHTALTSSTTHPPVTETVMGKYVPRLYLEYFNVGIPRTIEYELIDQGTNLSNREQKFGLLRNDGSEKPAFTYLKRLLDLVRDPGSAFTRGRLDYKLAGDLTNLHHTLLQKRDGRFYLILWLEVPSTDALQSRSVTLSLARARDLSLFVPALATTPQKRVAGVRSLALTVTDRVTVIELR